MIQSQDIRKLSEKVTILEAFRQSTKK